MEGYSRNVSCTLHLTLSVPDEGYSRNVSCTLHLILSVPDEGYSRKWVVHTTFDFERT